MLVGPAGRRNPNAKPHGLSVNPESGKFWRENLKNSPILPFFQGNGHFTDFAVPLRVEMKAARMWVDRK